MGTPAQVAQMAPLDIGNAIHELVNQVTIGTAHLSFAKSVAAATNSHPVILSVSPHFFVMTTNAHLECAQLYAAKLFDKPRDCASIPWLLEQARNRPQAFANATITELGVAIQGAEAISSAQDPLLTSLKHRRDRWLAHLDRKTVKDQATFAENAKLTFKELEGIFAAATEILKSMAILHGAGESVIDGSHYNDFAPTLQLIEKGVQANATELEQRIGPCPDVEGSF